MARAKPELKDVDVPPEILAVKEKLDAIPKSFPKMKALDAAGKWRPEALQLLEDMAASGMLQKMIAAHFKMTHKTFQGHVQKDKYENPVHLAWEAGHAIHEQGHANLIRSMCVGDSKGAVVAAIFYAKAQFGWRDRPEQGGNVTSGVTFILPGSMSSEEYYKKLGIAGPLQSGQDVPAIEPPRDVTPMPALPSPDDAVTRALALVNRGTEK